MVFGPKNYVIKDFWVVFSLRVCDHVKEQEAMPDQTTGQLNPGSRGFFLHRRRRRRLQSCGL